MIGSHPDGAVFGRPHSAGYDVVVIGARVAGAATAMLLARRGHKVLMVDRAPAGADTTSTHAVLRSGVLQLKRWGLLDRVIDSGTPAIPRVTLGFGSELVPIDLSDDFGVDSLYAPRRTVLDPILVGAAVEAGVEYLDRCRAKSLVKDADGTVRGVVLDAGDGEVPVQARMVIGADGAWSKMARWVNAPTYSQYPAANTVYYAYYSGIETHGVYFQFTPGVTAGLIPTNDDLVCVYGGWPKDTTTAFRDEPDSAFTSLVGSAHPLLEDAMASATRATPFRGIQGLAGFLRKPGGPGWALVGDAAYTKDPVSAHGISDALRDAELCACAVDVSLTDPGTTEAAFGRYQTVRDELSSGMLAWSSELAAYRWDEARASQLMRNLSGAVKAESEALVSGVGMPLPAV
jgi:2-polyprenyl-6-methoxyphenol hydroxylase-like FAD-dependent oxidoreductase